jgi:uncharacterized protein YndB with AHSA1/START domain
MSQTANAEFIIARVFSAPRPRVWAAWTQPDQLLRWLGPKGTSGTVYSADVRVGGLLHWHMGAPGGHGMWGRAIYREIDVPSWLTYVQSFSDEAGAIARAPFFDGRWPLEMLTEVTFAEQGEGTLLTLRWSPIAAEPDEVANFIANIPSMNGGWGGSFDQLEALLAS